MAMTIKARKIAIILKRVVISILVLIAILVIVIESKPMQKWLTSKAVELISVDENFGYKLESVQFHPFNTVVIKGLAVIDKHPYIPSEEIQATYDHFEPKDTIVKVDYLSARFSLLPVIMGKGRISVQNVYVKGMNFNLTIEPSWYPEDYMVIYHNNLTRLTGADPRVDKPKKEGSGPVITIDKVVVEDSRITTSNVTWHHKKQIVGSVDYGGMDFREINLVARDIKMEGGVTTVRVESLNTLERGGYRAKNWSLNAEITAHRTTVTDIHIIDEYSDTWADKYEMRYLRGKSFNHYTDSVTMEICFRKGSHIDTRTLGTFVSPVLDTHFSMDIDGHIIGPLHNLTIDSLNVTNLLVRSQLDPKTGEYVTRPDATPLNLRLKGAIRGIRGTFSKYPEPPVLYYEADIDRMSTSMETVQDLMAEFSQRPERLEARKKAYYEKEGWKYVEGQFVKKKEKKAAKDDKGSKDAEDGKSDILSQPWVKELLLYPQIHLSGSMDTTLNASVSLKTASKGSLSLGASLSAVPAGATLANAKASARTTALADTRNDKSRKDDIKYAALTLSTDSLEVGYFLGNEMFGPLTTNLSLKTLLGGKDGLEAILENLDIKEFVFNNYCYRGIAANASIVKNDAKLELKSEDSNLRLGLEAQGNLEKKDADLSLDLEYMDMYALNFYPKEGSLASFNLEARYGDGTLDAVLKKMMLCSGEDSKHIPTLRLHAFSGPENCEISVKSDVVSFDYQGDKGPRYFIDDITSLLARENIPSLFESKGEVWDSTRYNLNLKLKRESELLAYFKPEIYIEEGTSAGISISPSGTVDLAISSARLGLGNKSLKDVNFKLNNRTKALKGLLTIKDITLGKSAVHDCALRLYGANDNVGLGLSYDSEDFTGGKGELYVRGNVKKSVKNPGKFRIDLEMLPSSISLGNTTWVVTPSTAYIDGKTIEISNFKLESAEQFISIDGGFNSSVRDSLVVAANDIDISIVNDIVENFPVALRGLLGGEVTVWDDAITGQFSVDSTYVSDRKIGRITIDNRWVEEEKKFELRLRTAKMINAVASLKPETKELGGRVKLDSLDMALASIFVSKVAEDLSGYVSGNINLSGTSEDIKVRGDDIRLFDTQFTLVPTGVNYRVNGGLSVSEDGIHFKNFKIYDKKGGSATVAGGINMVDFKDPSFAMKVNLKDFEVMDKSSSNLLPLAGHLSLGGAVRLDGPLPSLRVGGAIETSGKGNINVSLNKVSAKTDEKILTYTQKPKDEEYVDPYDKRIQEQERQSKKDKDLDVDLEIKLSKDMNIRAEIDAAGNALSVAGDGQLALRVRPAYNIMSLDGNYDIYSGKVHLSVMGIVMRNLDIKSGSSVRFGGDILQSTLDVDAIYKTRTSIANLIADSTAVGLLKNVECGLHLSEKLVNPKLGFNITIPGLDPSIQSYVESALNTEEKVQKQFFAVLLTNSFLPEEQSGVESSTTTALYSNMSGFMSGQLNNIMQKLDIPVDFGLKYQRSSSGMGIFDVAISTQLFDNRVVINGNIGNRQVNTSNSSVAGDLECQFKVNKTGTLRVSAFTRSSDDYTNYLDNLQRTGVGISYSKEYNKFAEFIRYIFASKAKKQEMDEEERRRMATEVKRVTVN